MLLYHGICQLGQKPKPSTSKSLFFVFYCYRQPLSLPARGWRPKLREIGDGIGGRGHSTAD